MDEERHIPAGSAAQMPGTYYYAACLVMFAAMPTAITLLWLHEWTAAYVAFGVMGALECFFLGYFCGRHDAGS